MIPLFIAIGMWAAFFLLLPFFARFCNLYVAPAIDSYMDWAEKIAGKR